MYYFRRWLFAGIFTIFSLGQSDPLEAHPTSYQGSRGLMGEHAPGLSHNQLNYSWKYWFATGLHYYRRPVENEDARQATFASANFLLKRWNKSNLQANLYALGGVGYSDFSGNGSEAFYTGAQFDIEDRDYYFLVKHKHLFTKDNSDLYSTTARAGFTPYVDDFDGIHSWIILDVTQMRFAGESPQWMVTPTLRVFYQNLLFELGHSFDGQMVFNYITHF